MNNERLFSQTCHSGNLGALCPESERKAKYIFLSISKYHYIPFKISCYVFLHYQFHIKFLPSRRETMQGV